MASTSIVRIGPTTNDNVCSRLLRDAMVSYFHRRRNSNNNDESNDDGDDESRIVVENKYFSANVVFADIEDLIGTKTNNNGNGDADNSGTTTTTKEDGAILVFDGLKSNPDRLLDGITANGTTFDDLDRIQNRLNNNNDNDQPVLGDLLRLCVGVSVSPSDQQQQPQDWRGQNHEKEYSRRILWCLDHGYEYVEVDLSEDGQRRGHDQRDKEGFARIIEAIEGTVWSSAVMGHVQTKQLRNTYADDKAALVNSSSNNNNNNNEEDKKQPNGNGGGDSDESNTYVPPDPSQLVSQDESINNEHTNDEKKEVEERTNSLLENIETENITTTTIIDEDNIVLDPSNVAANDIAKLREDMEVEKHFDQMDTVIQEAKRIREASQNGTMSDDERRERAGDAALALLNLMGQFGLEDDDDDDDDEDSDVES